MNATLLKKEEFYPEINLVSADFEQKLQERKMKADFRILDVNGKKLYVCENATKTYKWISAKEEKTLKEQGKTFVTDF
jgi:hypothetical protein